MGDCFGFHISLMATDILKCDIETAIVAMAMVEQIRKSARVPRLFGDESVQDLVSGFGFWRGFLFVKTKFSKLPILSVSPVAGDLQKNTRHPVRLVSTQSLFRKTRGGSQGRGPSGPTGKICTLRLWKFFPRGFQSQKKPALPQRVSFFIRALLNLFLNTPDIPMLEL